MATTYPSDPTKKGQCVTCYTAQCKETSGCTSTTSKNSSTNYSACSTYCDVGCNSKCDTAQGICVVHDNLIRNHADVGEFPIGTAVAGVTIIHDLWTAEN